MNRVIKKFKLVLTRFMLYKKIRYFLSSEKCNTSFEDADLELRKVAPMPISTAITVNKISKKKYDLTIIVPAYNTQKWIKECIDSVLNQVTKYSYLLVVVDDGSKDDTGMIIDSYLPHSHMKVIHQENRGHAGARNIALKSIESEYVMFLDSDDYLLPDAIEILISEAIRTNADIVEGNGYSFNDNGRLNNIKKDSSSLRGVPWMKVIRSELFKNLEFPEGYLYEDAIISWLVFPIATKVVTVPNEIYAYRIHKDSITQKHTADLNRIDSFWIMLLMQENMKQMGLSVNFKSYLRVLKHIIFTYRRTILLPENIQKDIFVCTKYFLLKNYSEYLNEKNIYFPLVKSLMNSDFGKYKVFCELFNF